MSPVKPSPGTNARNIQSHIPLPRTHLALALMVALAIALCLLFPEVLRAAPRRGQKAPQVDHLELATVLLRDGHVARAAAILAKLRPETPGLDKKRYHTLSGIVASRQNDHRGVIGHLEAAVALGEASPRLQLLLAQSHHHLKDPRRALAALDRAGEAAAQVWGAWLIRAQSHLELGQRLQAFTALTEGLRRHPRQVALGRQLVLLLVRLKLYVQASEEGHRLLTFPDATLEDSLGIAEALRRAGQPRAAALLLEESRLRAPYNRQVLLQLARCHLDDGKPLAAATLLHRAALVDPALRVEAAELYRRARQPGLALMLNAQVTDQPKKIRQRFGLLMELGRFEEAVALAPRLSRLGLLTDDDIRFALAFCQARIGQHAQAEASLAKITKPELFDRVVELRQRIALCRHAGWECMQ